MSAAIKDFEMLRRRGTSKCRLCGKGIFWIRLSSGKLMPYDIEPLEDVTEGTMPQIFTDEKGKMHVTHFATCPNADTHRRRGKDD